MSIPTFEELIDTLELSQRKQIIHACLFDTYIGADAYIANCIRDARKIKISRPLSGIYGEIGVRDISVPKKEELEAIREELEKRFKAIEEKARLDAPAFQAKVEKAKERIDELVREFYGTWKIKRIYTNATVVVDAVIPEVGLYEMSFKAETEDKLLSDISTWRNTLNNIRKRKSEKDKARLIASIQSVSLSSILEDELKALSITPKVYTDSYENYKCSLSFYDQKIELDLDLNGGIEETVTRIRTIAGTFSQLYAEIKDCIDGLEYSDLYSLKVFISRSYGQPDSGQQKLKCNISRNSCIIFEAKVPFDAEETYVASCIENAKQRLSFLNGIDLFICSVSSGEERSWKLMIGHDHIRIEKGIIFRDIEQKGVSVEKSLFISELAIKDAIVSIREQESLIDDLNSKCSEFFSKKCRWKISYNDHKSVRLDLFNGDPVGMSYTVKLDEDFDKQLKEISNILFGGDDSIKAQIMSHFDNLPVSCDVSRLEPTTFSARVRIPGMPTIARTIHADNRLSKDINDLVTAVNGKLRMLHII